MKTALDQKLEYARNIMGQAFERFSSSFSIAWTGGKDSTLALALALDVVRDRGLGAPTVITIDEGDSFPEIEAFIKQVATDWGLEVHVLRNENIWKPGRRLGDVVPIDQLSEDDRVELAALGAEEETFIVDPESVAGNHLLKTSVLKRYIEQFGVQGLCVAIRHDEHGSRTLEEPFSPRFNPFHTRVHPILHLSERDVWDATFALELPFCELYRQGYRSLGTRTGTIRSSDIPAWEQDLEGTSERSGRAVAKEEAMDQLRALGYM